MELYIKATLKSRPERIIVHCGTNDLKNNATQSIIDIISLLSRSSQQEKNIVFVSFIIPRKDHLDKKKKGKRLTLL